VHLATAEIVPDRLGTSPAMTENAMMSNPSSA
jgi:hypothetical protein